MAWAWWAWSSRRVVCGCPPCRPHPPPAPSGRPAARDLGRGRPGAGRRWRHPRTLALQAHGGDPGRGRGQEPVAVQLPGMPGHAQGEGLARPRPADDHGDALAALAQVPDHRLLIARGGWAARASRTASWEATAVCSPVRPVARDQPLLDRQQVGVDQRRSSRDRSATTLTARSAKNRSASSSSSVRPAPARPAPRATRTRGGRRWTRARSARPGRPADRTAGWPPPRTPSGPGRGWAVRPVTVADHRPGRVRARPPRPASGRTGCPGSCCLQLAGRLDGHLDQPRRPLPTVRGQPVEFGVDLAGALGESPDQRLGHPLSSRLP